MTRKKKTAEDFLIERHILIRGAKKFPLNLSRDCHIQSKKDIIQAMEDYVEYKEAFNVTNETGHTPRQLAEQKAELLEACVQAQDELMKTNPNPLNKDDRNVLSAIGYLELAIKNTKS